MAYVKENMMCVSSARGRDKGEVSGRDNCQCHGSDTTLGISLFYMALAFIQSTGRSSVKASAIHNNIMPLKVSNP